MSLKKLFKKQEKVGKEQQEKSTLGQTFAHDVQTHFNDDVDGNNPFDHDTKMYNQKNLKNTDPNTEDYESELESLYKNEGSVNKASKLEELKSSDNYGQDTGLTSIATTADELFANTEIPEELANELKKNNQKKSFVDMIKGLFTKKPKKPKELIVIDTKEADFERKTVIGNEAPQLVSKNNQSDTVSITTKESVNNSYSKHTTTQSTEDRLEKQMKKLPLIGSMDNRKQYSIAGSLAIVAVFGLVGGIYLQNQAVEERNLKIQLASKMFSDYKTLNFYVSDAVLGDATSFKNAQKQWDFILKNYHDLLTIGEQLNADDRERVAAITSKLEAENKKLERIFTLLKQEEVLLKNTTQNVETTDLTITRLTELVDRLGIIKTQLGANREDMMNIFFLKNKLQNLNNHMLTIYLQPNITEDTIVSLNRTRSEIRTALSDMYHGNNTKGIEPINFNVSFETYSKLADEWVKFASTVDELSAAIPRLVELRNLNAETNNILTSISGFSQQLNDELQNTKFNNENIARILIILSILLIVLSILIAGLIYNYEQRNSITREEAKNNVNQAAILRLLNEIMPLQDGDLTKETTVDDAITAAIADSINATIVSLRSLVSKIRDASFAMREKTNEVNTISIEMLKSAENQATSITETGQSMLEITNAIKQISQQALETSKTAKESSDLSTKGVQKVFESIDSMQKISSNMNETVLLMKKVGESSKQISDIVGLLSDITEETNILALNATVQAAKAGEAGKGFKIVSDSIQELADKAADATRRVGALISAVQTDIQSVGSSIDKTTKEVERGVSLSENAGQVLSVIKNVSEALAKIVESVSEDALKHAKISEQISENVKVILDTTQKNKESTENTTKAIADIANVSNELGESVQSFNV